MLKTMRLYEEKSAHTLMKHLFDGSAPFPIFSAHFTLYVCFVCPICLIIVICAVNGKYKAKVTVHFGQIC